ncbi:MAG TPA: hypothetical protein VFH51_03535, partial [Myxococcota bacterium]|nr:hypothetical protein [Myxococcota bacterium]
MADEPLAATPSLQVTLPDGGDGAGLFGAPTVAGLVYTWTYALVGTDLDGAWSYTVTGIRDAAGNGAADVTATGRVDQAPPGLTVGSVNPLLVKAATPVTVSFTADENQAVGYPRLSVGGVSVALNGGPARAYSAMVMGLSGGDGAKTVQVTLQDTAGNGSVVTLPSVTLDTTLGLGSLSVSPAQAAAGATVTVQYVATELLQGIPTLAVTLPNGAAGAGLFGAPIPAGLVFTWTHALTGADPNGVWQYSLGGIRDRAGNIAGPATATNTVDQAAPTVSGPSVAPSLARMATAVTASFTVSEALATNPIVTVGRSSMTYSSQVGNTYTYLRVTDGTEGAGVQGVVVNLADAAGNTAARSLGSVTYDFTTPTVSSAAVLYTPGPGNAIATPTSATNGTTVTVIVAASETLHTGTPPTLVARKVGGANPNSIAFTTTSYSSAGATFQATVSGSTADGNYTPFIAWTDPAGNATASASFSAPLIAINTSVPSSGAIKTAQLKHLRIPWGATQNSDTQGHYVVPIDMAASTDPRGITLAPALFTAAGDTLVQVRAYSASNGGALMGVSAPTNPNWQGLSLTSLDADQVWVSVVDTAGNESSRVRVKNVEWVATMGIKSAGDTFANPHRFEARVVDWQGLEQTTATEMDIMDGIVKNSSPSQLTTTSGPFIRQPATTGPTDAGGVVYDSKRGRLYVFPHEVVGRLSVGFRQMWVWQNGEWSLLNATDPEGDGNPRATMAPNGQPTSDEDVSALCYDVARDRIVLYLDATETHVPETWEFNGASWKLVRQGNSPNNPNARWHAAMAYDANQRVSVLFG